MLSQLPQIMVQSFTIEKNLENPYIMSKDDIDVYFCHSYASWEKSGVENFNGLIRKIYPKGFDFSTITQD